MDKRKELAQMVYDKYTPNLTNDEKKELENEVYSSINGYEKALLDITQLIVDGKDNNEIVTSVKDYILHQLNGKSDKDLFRFSEFPTTEMRNYINSTVRDELIQKGENEKDVAAICGAFINYPSSRQSIIDRFDLDSIRICEHCGRLMHEGYLKDEYYTYCSEECVKEACNLSDEEFFEMVSHAEEDNAPLFWTEWE